MNFWEVLGFGEVFGEIGYPRVRASLQEDPPSSTLSKWGVYRLLDVGTGSKMSDWRTTGMLPVEVLAQCPPSAGDRDASGSESSRTLQS